MIRRPDDDVPRCPGCDSPLCPDCRRRPSNRGWFAAAAAVVAAVLLTGCQPVEVPDVPPATSSSAAPAPGPVGDTGRVTRVVDGDTADVTLAATGETVRVRVLGIDTPEVYGGVECWGREASAFARDTLDGQAVTVVPDPSQDAVDHYDRRLAYLMLQSGGNYSVLAARAGAARSYVYRHPVAAHAAITAAEDDARAAGRGLWGACS